MCQIEKVYNKTKESWKHQIIEDPMSSNCKALYKSKNGKVHGRELLYNELDYGVRFWIEVTHCFSHKNKIYGEHIEYKEEKITELTKKFNS